MSNGYELNEKDIDAVIRFLKIYDPEHATPEIAIAFLKYMRAAYRTMVHDNPELTEEVYQDFKEQKKLKGENI